MFIAFLCLPLYLSDITYWKTCLIGIRHYKNRCTRGVSKVHTISIGSYIVRISIKIYIPFQGLLSFIAFFSNENSMFLRYAHFGLVKQHEKFKSSFWDSPQCNPEYNTNDTVTQFQQHGNDFICSAHLWWLITINLHLQSIEPTFSDCRKKNYMQWDTVSTIP